MNKTLQLVAGPEEEPKCKGQLFRYIENAYIGKRGDVNLVRRLVPLRRLSCPGCSKCGWTHDDLNEGIYDKGGSYLEFDPAINPNDIVAIRFIPDSYDWESGYLDSWHLRVVPHK